MENDVFCGGKGMGRVIWGGIGGSLVWVGIELLDDVKSFVFENGWCGSGVVRMFMVEFMILLLDERYEW